MDDERNDAILGDADIDRLWNCLGNAIALLDIAANLLSQAIKMPFADPDDPVWEEFQKKPYINEAIDVWGQIFDAKATAQKTIEIMAANADIPGIRFMEGGEING